MQPTFCTIRVYFCSRKCLIKKVRNLRQFSVLTNRISLLGLNSPVSVGP